MSNDSKSVMSRLLGSGGILTAAGICVGIGWHIRGERAEVLSQRLVAAQDSERRAREDLQALIAIDAASLPKLAGELAATCQAIRLSNKEAKELEGLRTAVQQHAAELQEVSGRVIGLQDLLRRANEANQAMAISLRSAVSPQEVLQVREGSGFTVIPNVLTVGVTEIKPYAAPVDVLLQAGEEPAKSVTMSAGERRGGTLGDVQWWITLEGIDPRTSECKFRVSTSIAKPPPSPP